MKPSEIKNFVSIIKSFGYNTLLLYTEDTYEVKGEPYFGYMRGRYSLSELKDIKEYCAISGVELIPCIQTLAHLNQIFRWSKYREICDMNDILLPGDERTYALIENMFISLREVWEGGYIHVGMDEAHNLGRGRYFDLHGGVDRFHILSEHLNRVIKIAEKYGFKPIIWSDMFFRLANNGNYYPENPVFGEDAKKALPQNLSLCYWDYYHEDESYFSKMLSAHEKSGAEIWFAGGAWTWTGFGSGNSKSFKTMFPAMRALKKTGVKNVFITMWGDNGKECSFYSVLPSLYAIRKIYDGEENIEEIKKTFKDITGEDFDALCYLDNVNFVVGNTDSNVNVSKFSLYNDPFNGFLDSTLKDGVGKEYSSLAEKYSALKKSSNSFGYIFNSAEKLCRLLSFKYDLGILTRKAYSSKDKKQVLSVIKKYRLAIKYLDEFYKVFSSLWYKENKPQGFDVQDIRLGGLRKRLESCAMRLNDFAKGKIDCIPELEEPILDYYGNGEDFKKDPPAFNYWADNVTCNSL